MSAVATTPEAATPAGTQILTIDPQQYVAAVFAPFVDRLAEAKKAIAEIKEINVTDRPGMALAIKHRAVFRSLRLEAEAARKLRKAPILSIGKLLDSRHAEIEEQIVADETRFDSAIKAEEKRIEDARLAKIAAEAERVAKIQDRIQSIRTTAILAVNRPSAEVEILLSGLVKMQIDESFGEFLQDAIDAEAETVRQLETILASRKEAEAAAEKLRQDQIELARLQAVERDRLAAEQAARDEADRNARERLRREDDERRAKIAQEQAEHEAKMKAEREAQARIDAEARAQREAADREAAELRRVAQEKSDAEIAERRRAQEQADSDARAAREAEQKRIDDERARLQKLADEATAKERHAASQEMAKAQRLREASGDLMRCVESVRDILAGEKSDKAKVTEASKVVESTLRRVG